DVLYADKSPTVTVKGRVALRGPAPAGATFDYVVEWAPGVDPDDNQWKTIAHAEMVAAPVDGPLGDWDISGITVQNPVPKPGDSAFQPDDAANVHTVTLRVRATVHAADPMLDGVRGESRRAVHIQRDPDLLPGFPLHIGASGEASPKLADLDGD